MYAVYGGILDSFSGLSGYRIVFIMILHRKNSCQKISDFKEPVKGLLYYSLFYIT